MSHKPPPCPFCGFHEEMIDAPFRLGYEPWQYLTYHLWQRHSVVVRRSVTTYDCLCGYTFQWIDEWEKHLREQPDLKAHFLEGILCQ